MTFSEKCSKIVTAREDRGNSLRFKWSGTQAKRKHKLGDNLMSVMFCVHAAAEENLYVSAEVVRSLFLHPSLFLTLTPS